MTLELGKGYDAYGGARERDQRVAIRDKAASVSGNGMLTDARPQQAISEVLLIPARARDPERSASWEKRDKEEVMSMGKPLSEMVIDDGGKIDGHSSRLLHLASRFAAAA